MNKTIKMKKGFKKFSDIKVTEEQVDKASLPVKPFTDEDIPMNVNLPKKKVDKIEKFSSRQNILTHDQDVVVPVNLGDADGLDTDYLTLNDKEESTNENVETYGKLAKFPKNVKASKAYNFLENVKVSKKSIWYILVEKDNELQMVKYNHKEGVDLNKFVNGLKEYYISKNEGNVKIIESINKMTIDGNDKFSMIKNIPNLKYNNKHLITKITEDLIKLLSK